MLARPKNIIAPIEKGLFSSINWLLPRWKQRWNRNSWFGRQLSMSFLFWFRSSFRPGCREAEAIKTEAVSEHSLDNRALANRRITVATFPLENDSEALLAGASLSIPVFRPIDT